MSFLFARTRAGLSQAAAAEKLGISSASVCQWETGKNLPRADKLPEIASLYGCSVDELLADESKEPTHLYRNKQSVQQNGQKGAKHDTCRNQGIG